MHSAKSSKRRLHIQAEDNSLGVLLALVHPICYIYPDIFPAISWHKTIDFIKDTDLDINSKKEELKTFI